MDWEAAKFATKVVLFGAISITSIILIGTGSESSSPIMWIVGLIGFTSVIWYLAYILAKG